MRKSQLVLLLETLSKQELRQMKKIIRSTYFNTRTDVILLFDYLVKYMGTNKLQTKEAVFQEVYPKERYNQQLMLQRMSWLQKAIEQYLVMHVSLSDAVKMKTQLAGIYRQRNLEKHFSKSMREAKNILSEQKERGADHFELCYLLQKEEYLAATGNKRMAESNLQELSDDLDLSYMIRKLQQACFSIAHQSVYNIKYKFGFLREILAYIDRHQLTATPAIGTYYYCYKALSEPEEEGYFVQFKIRLLRDQVYFSLTENRDLFLLATNYCIRKLNEGQLQYAGEGLEIYRKGLEKEVLFINGVLSRFTYQNIVGMGIKMKDYEWVTYFIENYRSKLDVRYRDSVYSFNMATVEHSRKNYQAALSLLQNSDYSDLLMNLTCKTLAAKIYFEIDEYLLLDAHLQTMQVFIRRKKIIGYHKKNYMNTIKYIQRLCKLPLYGKEQREKLRALIEAEETLTEKAWLLEQLQKRR